MEADFIKTKHWILILGSIVLLSLLAILLPHRFSSPATYVEIYQNGTLLTTVPLSHGTAPVTIPIKDGEKENIIVIENGGVRVSSATCPDKLCVHQGTLTDTASAIVCLPHRLVIKLVGGTSSVDAVSQ